jgi:hypothetical protein
MHVRDTAGVHVGKIVAVDATGVSLRHGLREVRVLPDQLAPSDGEAVLAFPARTLDERAEGAVPFP